MHLSVLKATVMKESLFKYTWVAFCFINVICKGSFFIYTWTINANIDIRGPTFTETLLFQFSCECNEWHACCKPILIPTHYFKSKRFGWQQPENPCCKQCICKNGLMLDFQTTKSIVNIVQYLRVTFFL